MCNFCLLRRSVFFRAAVASAVIIGAPVSQIYAADLIDYPTYDEFGEPVYNDVMSVSAGFGLVNISANEIVYNGSSLLSLLTWDSVAIPTVSVRVDAHLDEGWTFEASGEAGIGGYSEMVDKDWIAPFAPGNGPDDWSDRSIHPDTNVDHYFSGRIAMGYDVIDTGDVALNLKGGFSYTDVQWTGRGGSYIYSNAGLHDSVGNFAAGVAVITYEQSMPAAFVGAELRGGFGDISFSTGVEGGFTFFATATDHHYLRNLLFVDDLQMAPMVSANARVDYNFSSENSIYLAAAVQKMFTARGDTTITDTGTNAVSNYSDIAGADFASLSLSVGISATFQ